MGLIKPNDYTFKEVHFADIANAFSHPARNRIVEMLQNGEQLKQVQLPEILRLSKASVCRHLNSLRKAELLDNEYFIHYELLRLNMKTVEKFQNQFKKLVESQLNTGL